MTKIASILQIGQQKEKTEEHPKYFPVNNAGLIEPMTVEESYKRLLRDSVCRKSKYLSMFSNNSFITANTGLNTEQQVKISE